MQTAAIIGAGTVGRALGERLVRAGARVRFGVREPGAVTGDLTGPLAGAAVLSAAEAAAGADLILLAVPAAASVEALRSVGELGERIVIDCTNPVRWDGGPVWAPPPEGSVAQAVAAALPRLRVVKGFNHFGAEIQRDPALATGPADALFAGDDCHAKSVVMALATRMGFRPRDAGPLRNAGLLENLAILWIHLATGGGAGREFGFRIEGRSGQPASAP